MWEIGQNYISIIPNVTKGIIPSVTEGMMLKYLACFPPTLGKALSNTFGLKNLNLPTFEDKKSQFFYDAITIFSTPCGSS